MFQWLKPAPFSVKLPEEEVDNYYKLLRRQVFTGIFIGYAGYYLVRKNFSLAVPELIKEGFDKGELGLAMAAVSLAYGLSKFFMGGLSDRSNPRYFLPLGLLISAGIMAMMGLLEWATSSIAIMFVLLFANGWVQGMGWPASGRVMVHWFSIKERGSKMAVWNIAHNVGGGLIGPLAIAGLTIFGDWRSAFYFPAIPAVVVAAVAYRLIRDTPQSEGLPPIEVYKKDFPPGYNESNAEQEMSAREIFVTHVLKNKMLLYIALANAFVYMIRYGVLDWAPAYLDEVKGYNTSESSWAYFAYEFAGIPGTLLCGYLSDTVFKGKRAPASILYLIAVIAAVLVYWLNPPGNSIVDMVALTAIGFLIYGPVMLIGVHALDLAPKKAAGTAAGFTGLFGYIGGAVLGNVVIGYMTEHIGWNGGFALLTASGVLAILFLSLTLKKNETA